MRKILLALLLFFPLLTFSQPLTEASNISITKFWSQEPNGFTYPMSIHVPTGTVPQNGYPVCILLHGNGGNGSAMLSQFEGILECHVLVAPTGYLNSWNICAENSDAPDVEMLNELIIELQSFSNIDPNRIRVAGSSNGAGLANRVFIENTNTGVDAVCAMVSHLNLPQFHSGQFHRPSGVTASSTAYCGYDTPTDPLTSRRYLNMSNINDPIIPYAGGSSVVGVEFHAAEDAIYTVAQHLGYSGTQLTTGTIFGNPAAIEFSYLAGNAVHVRGNTGHTANSTQTDYLKGFLSDCTVLTEVPTLEPDKVSLYPNPTNAFVTLGRTSSEVGHYTVINVLGEEVLRGVAYSRSTRIGLSDLPDSVYLLKLDGKIFRIVKQSSGI